MKSFLALLFPASLFYLKCFRPDEVESLKTYKRSISGVVVEKRKEDRQGFAIASGISR